MKNDTKTAIEWYHNEMIKFEKGNSEFFSSAAIYNYAFRMEKKQIMNDFLNGKMNFYDTKSISAEQYYEEKYKQYGLDNETRQILNNL